MTVMSSLEIFKIESRFRKCNKKFGEGAVVKISTVFWPVYHVTSERVL